jgi:hypothetical protein
MCVGEGKVGKAGLGKVFCLQVIKMWICEEPKASFRNLTKDKKEVLLFLIIPVRRKLTSWC